MNAPPWPLSLLIVKWATRVLALGFLLVALALAAPTLIGPLINPKTDMGSRGLTVLLMTMTAACVVLVLAFVVAATTLAREPGQRSRRSLLTMAGGAAAAALFIAAFFHFRQLA